MLVDSIECQRCEECDLCPVQDIDLVIYWFSVVMGGAIKMSNSPTGGTNAFSCQPKSVDQEMCRARPLCCK